MADNDSGKLSKAFLVGIDSREKSDREAEGLLDELQELVSNLGITTVARKMVHIREPHPAYLLGTGKTEEILTEALACEAEAIVFDEPLSPAQQRNWEKRVEGKLVVIDRQEIILEIFNARAHTREARLQVELARLEYELPRMKRAWSHLDRQRGGGTGQRDAGETQLELDQRLIRDRISRLRRELSEVVQHRQVQRQKRVRVPLPSAALIGYTNAGKSSLLNALADNAHVLAEDKLFATLDPTTRRSTLANGQVLLLTDTVGFIRRLPHRLVEAFKATLEEALVADVLIHVLDASSPDVLHHYDTTLGVLRELNALDKTRVTIFNKADRLNDRPDTIHELLNRFPEAVFCSALTGHGLEKLKDACQEHLKGFVEHMELFIPYRDYEWVTRLHDAGAVEASRPEDAGVFLSVEVPLRFVGPLKQFLVTRS